MSVRSVVTYKMPGSPTGGLVELGLAIAHGDIAPSLPEDATVPEGQYGRVFKRPAFGDSVVWDADLAVLADETPGGAPGLVDRILVVISSEGSMPVHVATIRPQALTFADLEAAFAAPSETPIDALVSVGPSLLLTPVAALLGDAPVRAFGTDDGDRLYTGVGEDEVRAREGDDFVWGSAGADILSGGRGTDLLTYWQAGFEGGVRVDLRDGFARLADGTEQTLRGFESVEGTGRPDRLVGSNGDDRLEGEGGGDALRGGVGDDTLFGESGRDRLLGGAGADELDGGDGDDLLRGGRGDDARLGGGDGDDRVMGGLGDDTLGGGLGADTLDGGAGSDVYRGEDHWSTDAAADVFVVETGEGHDRIEDFGVGADRIALRGVASFDDLSFSTPEGVLHVSLGDDLLVIVENRSAALDAEDFLLL